MISTAKQVAQQRIAYIEFMTANYQPGIEIVGYGDFYSCRTCGAVVFDTENALEQHVKWHNGLEGRLTAPRPTITMMVSRDHD